MAFSRDEIKAIVILGLVAGFILGFRGLVSIQDGFLHLDLGAGLAGMLVLMAGMVVSVYIHEWGHKAFGNAIGYETHVESYTPGLAVGGVLAFFTFGWLVFFTPNTCDTSADPVKRMHKHRKYENPRQQAFIAASGLFVTAALAVILHGAWVLTHSEVMHRLVVGNALLLVYSIIPFELLSVFMLRYQQNIEEVPESDGLYLLHYTPIAYVTMAAFIIVLALILTFTTSVPVWIALLIGLITGGFVWMKFFLEQN